MNKTVDNRKRYRGKLLGTQDEIILMDVEGQVFKLNFSDINKAKLVMTDELMALASTKPS